MKSDRWTSYYKLNEGRQPRRLFLESLKHLPHEATSALELGAGDLVEAKFLIEHDMNVVAIDSSEASAEIAKEVSSANFTFINTEYDEYDYPSETFDLVSAQLALPFNSPRTFSKVFDGIISSLKPGGIFCGHFFGPNDEWNTPDTVMTFTTREELRNLLSRLELISLNEQEADKPTAAGIMKHWHVFEVIARKS